MNRKKRKPDIILFSTADWDTPYWTNKQHMAMQFKQHGHRVLYIESVGLRQPGANSLDLFRIFKRLINGIRPARKYEKNIHVISPLVIPLWKSPVIRILNQYLLIFRIRSFMVLHGFRFPILWTYHPMISDILIRKIVHSKIIYHSVDDLTSVPGIDKDAIEDGEKYLLEKADLIFTTSMELKKKYSTIQKDISKIHYFSNVADLDHFSVARNPGEIPEDIMDIPHPRICYVGVLTDFKIDFKLIHKVIKGNPDWHWIFIGEEREGQKNTEIAELDKYENTHFLGYRPYSVIPDYLRGMDIAVIPSLINSYTRSMFPMKFFEYLAAGLPVIATEIPSLEEFSHLFHKTPDASSMAGQIQSILDNRSKGNQVINSLDEISEYSWERRFEKMMDLIK